MAELTSEANVAVYGRDTGVIATPPEEVFSHADRRRQSEERLGRDLRRQVRIEAEEGEEELGVLSDHNVEVDREALGRRRDQAVDEASRRMSASASNREEEQSEEGIEGDPMDDIEALLESERPQKRTRGGGQLRVMQRPEKHSGGLVCRQDQVEKRLHGSPIKHQMIRMRLRRFSIRKVEKKNR